MTEATEITPQAKFEDKIKDRIRNDIGDLIPDDVLAGLVEKAIEGIFFTGRVTGTESWNKQQQPSWIEKHLGELLKQKMEIQITQWMADNDEKMVKIIEEGIREGAPGLFANLFSSAMDQKIWNAQHQMQQMIAGS